MPTPYYGQKRNWLRLVVLTAIAGIFLLIVPYDSTPFYHGTSGDYNVFIVMAKGWMEGLIPYKDLFDHKGPLLYLLQIAGQLIAPGKLGIWILETLFAVISLELIYQCGRALRANPSVNYMAVAVSLLTIVFNIQGGNNNEEWCLPFQILPLLLAIKFLKDGRPGIKTVAIVCGLCFGLVAMVRLNNNVIIAGICLGQALILLNERQYADLLKCAVFFIVGMVIAILPFVIYFYSVGALKEMLYANFVFNIKYKMAWVAEGTSRTGIRYLWPCILLPVILLIFRKRNDSRVSTMLIAICVVTFATFITGSCYVHYYILVAPIAALCLLALPKTWKAVPQLTTAVVVLAPLLPIGPKIVYNRFLYCSNKEAISRPWVIETLSAAIRENIPAEEWQSVYLSMSPSEASALSGINVLPVGKYFFLQNNLSSVDDVTFDDITTRFLDANPQWVISNQRMDSIHPLREAASNYTLRKPIAIAGNEYLLYRRNN